MLGMMKGRWNTVSIGYVTAGFGWSANEKAPPERGQVACSVPTLPGTRFEIYHVGGRR
jgi:hypothetical protein